MVEENLKNVASNETLDDIKGMSKVTSRNYFNQELNNSMREQ